MSTHRTPDSWQKNLIAPRSLREAFDDRPGFLSPAPEENFTVGEVLVVVGAAAILFTLILTGVV